MVAWTPCAVSSEAVEEFGTRGGRPAERHRRAHGSTDPRENYHGFEHPRRPHRPRSVRDLRPTGTSLDPVHARPDRPPPASAGPRGVSLAHGVDREPETRQLNVRHPWRIPALAALARSRCVLARLGGPRGRSGSGRRRPSAGPPVGRPGGEPRRKWVERHPCAYGVALE